MSSPVDAADAADPVAAGGPFRGSRAVSAGAVTADRLRGPGFRRLAPDVHIAVATPLTLRVFLDALRLWCPAGVVARLAAAAVWCRADLLPVPRVDRITWPRVGDLGPVDLVVPARARAPAGVRVREDVLDPDEVVDHVGLRLTTPARTVLDLLRFAPREVAVTVGDAVARRGEVVLPDDVEELADRMRGSRGLLEAREILPLLDRRSGNLEISRMRLALRDLGVRPPVIDHMVQRDGWPVALADLAWPELCCAALCGERELVPGGEVRESALRSVGWSVWWQPSGAPVRTDAAAVAVAMMLRASALAATRSGDRGAVTFAERRTAA